MICIDKLDTMVNKNDYFCDLINHHIKDIKNDINDLESLYSGNDLQFLFQNFAEQVTELDKISSVVDSYSEVLRNVKSGYSAQLANIQYYFNRISSDTNNV